ncbi:MAG: thiamine pyrophosphate-binding protein [Myxococcota bacterium]|nr:thiamine pyrophosphate-binding protein [Myxococcota bacterium]
MTRRLRRRRSDRVAAIRPNMALGSFLVAYLERTGVEQIFGLPGDLVLGLFQRFGRARGLEIVTFSHEPAVGFAADGYARASRRLGVVCVTYGAGGHNVVNAVAGAYAERVPLLVVSGGPGEAEQKVALIHHQVKDVEAQSRIFDEVCCATAIIDRPELAAEQIHATVAAIVHEHRPGYLEIHRDLVDEKIPVPQWLCDWDGKFPRPRSNRKKLAEAVSETLDRLRAARRPLLLAGVELFRESADRDFRRFAENTGAPVVTTVLAKGVFPMSHPLHMGISIGGASHPAIQKRVKQADLVLALGSHRTDLNLGASRWSVPEERSIWAVDGRVAISQHEYSEVTLGEFVRALSRAKVSRRRERISYYDNLKRPTSGRLPRSRTIDVNDLLVELNDFLAEHADYHVVAESGDMLFGGLELRLHGKGNYFAQGFYASMGFAVPAAMGAQIATGIRPLVLCGDGGFQMTGVEIAHAVPKRLSPLVVIVNNGGWGIFRPVTTQQGLLEIPNWPYAEMANGWGGAGFAVNTVGELRDSLHEAHSLQRFAIIDVRVDGRDLSPLGKRYIEGSARTATTRR